MVKTNRKIPYVSKQQRKIDEAGKKNMRKCEMRDWKVRYIIKLTVT